MEAFKLKHRVHSPDDLILYKLMYFGLSQQSKHSRTIAAADTVYNLEGEGRFGHKFGAAQ